MVPIHKRDKPRDPANVVALIAVVFTVVGIWLGLMVPVMFEATCRMVN